jgi:hypothetical protein
MIRRMIKTRRIIALIVLVAVFVMTTPAPAFAGPFDFLRDIGRALGKVARTVLNAPHRVATWATKWMGPVLGPVAAGWLAGKFISNKELGRIFARAKEVRDIVKDVEFVEQSRKKLQAAYLADAAYHRQQAAEYVELVEEMKQSPQAGDVRNIVEARLLWDTHNRMAKALEEKAKNVTTDDVAKMLGKKVLMRLLGGAKKIVLYELSEEVKRLIDPNIIIKFIDGGMDPGTVIELIIANDASRLLRAKGLDDPNGELGDRLKDRLREELRNNRDFFKGNWKQEIDRIIEEIAAETPDAEPDTGVDEEIVPEQGLELPAKIDMTYISLKGGRQMREGSGTLSLDASDELLGELTVSGDLAVFYTLEGEAQVVTSVFPKQDVEGIPEEGEPVTFSMKGTATFERFDAEGNLTSSEDAPTVMTVTLWYDLTAEGEVTLPPCSWASEGAPGDVQ